MSLSTPATISAPGYCGTEPTGVFLFDLFILYLCFEYQELRRMITMPLCLQAQGGVTVPQSVVWGELKNISERENLSELKIFQKDWSARGCADGGPVDFDWKWLLEIM